VSAPTTKKNTFQCHGMSVPALLTVHRQPTQIINLNTYYCLVLRSLLVVSSNRVHSCQLFKSINIAHQYAHQLLVRIPAMWLHLTQHAWFSHPKYWILSITSLAYDFTSVLTSVTSVKGIANENQSVTESPLSLL
jgi:hypothetical protein